MRLVSALFARARQSANGLFLLNLVLRRTVPFNAGHGLRILSLNDRSIEVVLPYRRANLNHVGTLHACALATLAEYCSGALLYSQLGFATYRLILTGLQMTYHLRSASDAFARLTIEPDWLTTHVESPLALQGSASIALTVNVADSEGRLLCTAEIHWHIKPWSAISSASAVEPIL